MTVVSAGYDLLSVQEIEIIPYRVEIIKADITLKIPKGTYSRTAPRSSFFLKMLGVTIGVIDYDYV